MTQESTAMRNLCHAAVLLAVLSACEGGADVLLANQPPDVSAADLTTLREMASLVADGLTIGYPAFADVLALGEVLSAIVTPRECTTELPDGLGQLSFIKHENGKVQCAYALVVDLVPSLALKGLDGQTELTLSYYFEPDGSLTICSTLAESFVQPGDEFTRMLASTVVVGGALRVSRDEPATWQAILKSASNLPDGTPSIVSSVGVKKPVPQAAYDASLLVTPRDSLWPLVSQCP